MLPFSPYYKFLEFTMKALSIALYIVLFGLVGLNLALLIVGTPITYFSTSGLTVLQSVYPVQIYMSVQSALVIMYAYTMFFALLASSYFAVKYNII